MMGLFKATILLFLIAFAITSCSPEPPQTLYDNESEWDSLVTLNGMNPEGVFQFVERNPVLPDVLIIGTSISIGYTGNVRQILEGKANVYRVPQNGGHTRTLLDKQKEWFPGKKWDVIHFNFGLHDLKYVTGNKLDLAGEQVVPIDEYRKNLDEIIDILNTSLKRKGSLIFATTSVIPDSVRGRIKGDEVLYNKAALEVMSKHKGIIIDDQYALTLEYPEEQRNKNVHFFPEGKERQGQQVAESIETALNKLQ